MKNKLVISIITLSIISVVLAGCISEEQPKNTTGTVAGIDVEKKINIKYIDSNSIFTKEDFPDFELLDRAYYVARQNMTVSLEIEGVHGENMVNDTYKVPEGYRVYGISEAYNSSKDTDRYDRYTLIQYKVFDVDDKLSDSMNLTAANYMKAGFKSKVLDNDTLKNAAYKGRIFIFESNITNRTDVNVTVVLFGFDTVIGKIGVQDSKGRSFSETMRLLDIVFDRLDIKTKEVKPAKIDTYDPDAANRSNKSPNKSRY